MEHFVQTTPYGITLSVVYRPPSPPPSYQEVSPSISKVQSFTTPNNMFPSLGIPGSYIPSNPSVLDSTDSEFPILSSKSQQDLIGLPALRAI